MREIRFRVWDKILKQYHNNVQDSPGFYRFLNTKFYDVEQYTGLHDKNGLTELYEGDIVHGLYGQEILIGTVVFDYAQFLVTGNNPYPFTVTMSAFKEFEVIGNVHELTASESITAGIIKQCNSTNDSTRASEGET